MAQQGVMAPASPPSTPRKPMKSGFCNPSCDVTPSTCDRTPVLRLWLPPKHNLSPCMMEEPLHTATPTAEELDCAKSSASLMSPVSGFPKDQLGTLHEQDGTPKNQWSTQKPALYEWGKAWGSFPAPDEPRTPRASSSKALWADSPPPAPKASNPNLNLAKAP